MIYYRHKLQHIAIEKCGGNAKKVIPGKLILITEAVVMIALTAQGAMFLKALMTWQLSTKNLLANGIMIKTLSFHRK